MEALPIPKIHQHSSERATWSTALQAFFDSEFEACLKLCDALDIRDESMQIEVALLRARVELRLDHAEKAIDALRACACMPMSVDAHLSTQMLLGSAYVRIGQIERGEGLLANAHASAHAAHATVRAELAMNLGIARFQLGKYDEAEQLLSEVAVTADIVHARARQYLAWIAFAKGDFDTAATRFRVALHAIETSKHHDRFIEANVIQGLLALCAELLQTDEWVKLQARIRALDWSADGLTRSRFWVAMYASMMCEITGDKRGAREWARDAEYVSAAPAYQIMAQCRIAAVFRGLGNGDAHAEFIARAKKKYDSLSLASLGSDQKQLPLFLAEELVHGSSQAEAAQLVQQYRDIIQPTLRQAPGDDRYLALEYAVDACVCESAGNTGEAVHLFSEAFRLFRKANYRRRASGIALRLARLTGADRYVAYLKKTLHGLSGEYWMVEQLGDIGSAARFSVTKTELAILRLAAAGKTYKEIAAIRGGSWRTVRNRMHTLFAKLGASTKGEAVAMAIRHGLISAGIHDEGDAAE